jgi:hypothetical protein
MLFGQRDSFFRGTLLHFGSGSRGDLLALFRRLRSTHPFYRCGAFLRRHQLLSGDRALHTVLHAGSTLPTAHAMLHSSVRASLFTRSCLATHGTWVGESHSRGPEGH